MNASYRRLLLYVPFFAALLRFMPGSLEAEGEPERIRRMTDVAREGPARLLEYMRETRECAPLIYSQWYVDRLAATNSRRAEVEQAWREFGRTVLQSLEEMAPRLRSRLDARLHQDTALMLLDLADWFGEPPGYGNALLFHRLQDLATVPLAYLVADLSYTETNLMAMTARLVEFPEDVRRNARVLNLEAPEPIFEVPARSRSSVGVWDVMERVKIADGIVNPLERAWFRKVNEIMQWHKERGAPSGLPAGRGTREAAPEELAFYVDDEYRSAAGPFTTLHLWNGKYHRRLLLGLGSQNMREVRSLLMFRRKVGQYPTCPRFSPKQQLAVKEEIETAGKKGIKIVPLEEAYSSIQEAAFAQAWEPFRIEFGPTYSTAYAVYNSVLSNNFYDQDTRKANEHRTMQQANEAIQRDKK
jgi:hypothetical protein